MSIIERLKEEHNQILLFLDTFKQDLMNFMEHNTFDKNTYLNHIKFIREFADQKHHQREELILFKYMEEHLGTPAQKLIRNGMLVEHNLARYYVLELEKNVISYHDHSSLDIKLHILGLGYAYIELLTRHIEKENNVVYPFALRQLNKDIFDKMEKEEQQYLKGAVTK